MKQLKRVEILERKRKALAFAKKNSELSSREILKKLMQEFQYSYSSARNILVELGLDRKSSNKGLYKDYNKNTGEGLKSYLNKLEKEAQKEYERKMLKRPKIHF